jgi:hypothetical protein
LLVHTFVVTAPPNGNVMVFPDPLDKKTTPAPLVPEKVASVAVPLVVVVVMFVPVLA